MPQFFDLCCLVFSAVFFWSTLVVLLGLVRPAKRFKEPAARLKFAVLVCARNEERVIRFPVKSVLMSTYPEDCREVIVLADNCTDQTVAAARAAGATVWEKTTPSSGKGDVLAWGVARVILEGRFDAVAVFDADNVVSDRWFDFANAALQDGESAVTGRRHASNAKTNLISGWYAIYWDMMNELSNRVRTNLSLSGKLTGTGFAFLLSALGPQGWATTTMVEDVEFTVQCNLKGLRVAYLPEADYADEQPVTVRSMWRQLRRWSTGGWQVVRRYTRAWIVALVRAPSLRLFDSFFAILTGMSVAFIHLFNALTLTVKIAAGVDFAAAISFFVAVFGFVFLMGWFTALAAVALSQHKCRPRAAAILSFPLFSLVLSASVIYTLLFPTRRWKPITHNGI